MNNTTPQATETMKLRRVAPGMYEGLGETTLDRGRRVEVQVLISRIESVGSTWWGIEMNAAGAGVLTRNDEPFQTYSDARIAAAEYLQKGFHFSRMYGWALN